MLNYLAHAYLSFDDPEFLIGNLISDFVKGKSKFDYPEMIQKGIRLHRAIDHFTDNHEATKKAMNILRPYYRLYSGAFVDVIYDHFLATDTNEFNDTSLFDFSQQAYHMVDQYTEWLPDRFSRMYPYMKAQNWLYNYREKWGIEKSMEGVAHRAIYLSESQTAYQLFEHHYQLFGEHYRQFWSDLKPFALSQYKQLKEVSS